MAKRTAWLYVGLPHTGGTAVAATAAGHADTLRTQGIGLPTSAEEMQRASAELLRDHKEQGYRRRDVEGTWAAVCRRAWREKQSPLLGDERLAAADTDQVALLLDGLAGLRPHAVVALRDPASLLVEGWAAEVRQGRTPTFERYAERVLDPEAEHGQATRFRAAHDVPGILDRWVGALGPDRVHVVVLPPAGDPGPFLWQHLLTVVGVDPRLAGTVAAPDLGDGCAPHPAVLRAASADLKGRLSREERRDLLLTWLPQPGATVAGPPALPTDALAETVATAEKWRARVAESGVDVRGDLDDLVPAAAPADRRDPDDVATADGVAVATRALGRAALEVQQLRDRVSELESRTVTLKRKRTKLERRVARLGG